MKKFLFAKVRGKWKDKQSWNKRDETVIVVIY